MNVKIQAVPQVLYSFPIESKNSKKIKQKINATEFNNLMRYWPLREKFVLLSVRQRVANIRKRTTPTCEQANNIIIN